MASAIAVLDALLGGGIPRGRISEIVGRPGTGRTSLAAAFAAVATRRGEVVAWIDAAGALDPASIATAGVDLARVLWASIPPEASRARPASPREGRILKAAEMVLEAGGFGLVIVDFGDTFRAIPDSGALRLARAAERSGAAVIAIAPGRICGTFAALSIAMNRAHASFSRPRPASPALFDGLLLEASVARNKLGGSGAHARIVAAIDTQYRAQRVQNYPSPPGRRHWHAGDAAPRRVGEGAAAPPIAPDHPRNFSRAPLRSALNNDPHLTSPFQGGGLEPGEGSDAVARRATDGPSPDRVPVAPRLQGEGINAAR
ncbi:MAG TPA: ATPase domain-containing protein [Candidatus Binataceae bacterium]|nr:ATPase domain-containing protein [Candidatus Binataceae bacterium]